MPRFPRVPSSRRKRLIWETMILGGLERLTETLRDGRDFDDEDVADLIALAHRCNALSAAVEARIGQARAQGEMFEE